MNVSIYTVGNLGEVERDAADKSVSVNRRIGWLFVQEEAISSGAETLFADSRAIAKDLALDCFVLFQIGHQFLAVNSIAICVPLDNGHLCCCQFHIASPHAFIIHA